ncbi:hypothetical protein, partial [Megasphaera sp.]|uniref:hypothetical protein n=1 Tax=Megasphaera sp. TaxID=2023260 RepID=UPI0025B7E738
LSHVRQSLLSDYQIVARKSLPLHQNRLWRNHPSGLATCEPLRAAIGRFLGDLRPVTCGLHLFFIACMRFRRGRPDFSVCQLQDSSLDGQWLRAARYALRVSRSVVVSLSLSRRSRI